MHFIYQFIWRKKNYLNRSCAIKFISKQIQNKTSQTADWAVSVVHHIGHRMDPNSKRSHLFTYKSLISSGMNVFFNKQNCKLRMNYTCIACKHSIVVALNNKITTTTTKWNRKLFVSISASSFINFIQFKKKKKSLELCLDKATRVSCACINGNTCNLSEKRHLFQSNHNYN